MYMKGVSLQLRVIKIIFVLIIITQNNYKLKQSKNIICAHPLKIERQNKGKIKSQIHKQIKQRHRVRAQAYIKKSTSVFIIIQSWPRFNQKSMSLAAVLQGQTKCKHESYLKIRLSGSKVQKPKKIVASLPDHMRWKSPVGDIGYRLNEMLKEAIEMAHSCSSSEEKQTLLRRELKKVEEYDYSKIHMIEIISHWILPKLYYLEEKCREVKGVNMGKFGRIKNKLLQIIKNGFRDSNRVRMFYETAVEINQRRQEAEPPTTVPEQTAITKELSLQEKRSKTSKTSKQKQTLKVNQARIRRPKLEMASSSSSSSLSSSDSQSSKKKHNQRSRSRNKVVRIRKMRPAPRVIKKMQ